MADVRLLVTNIQGLLLHQNRHHVLHAPAMILRPPHVLAVFGRRKHHQARVSTSPFRQTQRVPHVVAKIAQRMIRTRHVPHVVPKIAQRTMIRRHLFPFSPSSISLHLSMILQSKKPYALPMILCLPPTMTRTLFRACFIATTLRLLQVLPSTMTNLPSRLLQRRFHRLSRLFPRYLLTRHLLVSSKPCINLP